MGLALKRLGLGGRIVGVSRSETIAQALELGVIDEGWGYDELQQVLKLQKLAELQMNYQDNQELFRM